MLLLVTGSSGFIGRHVAAAAIAQGYRVRGLDLKPACVEGLESHVTGDITDAQLVLRAMQDVEAVIHLAAVTSTVEFSKDTKRCYEVNVNGFLNVLDAAKVHAAKVKKVLYASSAAVYDWKTGQFHEEAAMDLRHQPNPYAQSKMINECTAATYHDLYGMDIVGMRFFNVYGAGENTKGDYASIITKFATMANSGEEIIIFGDGTQQRDFVHVNDVANLILLILKRATPEPVYNVGSGRPWSFKDIAKLVGPSAKYRFVPNPLKHYQMFTKADVTRLRQVAPDYECAKLEDIVHTMIKK